MRCDGCGSEVSDEHMRRRIERLEVATRFRPLHINVLLLAPAPPERWEDFFYLAEKDRATRSPSARLLFDDLMIAAGVPEDAGPPSGWNDEEVALAEFQRRGFYLAHVRECPFPSASEDAAAPRSPAEFARAFAHSAILRVRASFKPKKIALLGRENRELISAFERAGMKDMLVLDSGRVFVDSSHDRSPAEADSRTSLGLSLAAALVAGAQTSAGKGA